jgi:hypothetical protein
MLEIGIYCLLIILRTLCLMNIKFSTLVHPLLILDQMVKGQVSDWKLGLGRYIGVSVHRDIFSDDLRIDTPTQISILPFF